MIANLGKTGEGGQNLEERHARLAKVDGVSIKGGFEQRRTGCGRTAHKPACFERRNTDRFKAHCPIWIEKKKRWTSVIPATGIKGVAQQEKPN